MKTVYFVRHGETEWNEKGIYQHRKVPLSEKGLTQASFVAKRFRTIYVESILASDMTRAIQTAELIAGETGHAVEVEPLFQEILRPSEIRGKSLTDPSAVLVRSFIDENFETGLRHSDEENFHDLSQRARGAIQVLENRSESAIAVVTHGTFLKMMIAVMAFKEKLRATEYLGIDRLLLPSNTGITKCTFNNGKWQLVVWNDHAHLG